MTNDTLEENAGTVVVVVEAGTVIVVVVEGCVGVDERAAGGLLVQLAKKRQRTREPAPSTPFFRTAAFSRNGETRALRGR